MIIKLFINPSYEMNQEVIFGQYDVYLRELMKPKPATLLGLLAAYGAGGDSKPFIPFAGVTSLPNSGDLSSENYSSAAIARAGYRHSFWPEMDAVFAGFRVALPPEQHGGSKGGRRKRPGRRGKRVRPGPGGRGGRGEGCGAGKGWRRREG